MVLCYRSNFPKLASSRTISGSSRWQTGAKAQRSAPCLLERIRHDDTEIAQSAIEIFRQDALAAATLRRGHDHSVIEVNAILGVNFRRPKS